MHPNCFQGGYGWGQASGGGGGVGGGGGGGGWGWGGGGGPRGPGFGGGVKTLTTVRARAAPGRLRGSPAARYPPGRGRALEGGGCTLTARAKSGPVAARARTSSGPPAAPGGVRTATPRMRVPKSAPAGRISGHRSSRQAGRPGRPVGATPPAQRPRKQARSSSAGRPDARAGLLPLSATAPSAPASYGPVRPRASGSCTTRAPSCVRWTGRPRVWAPTGWAAPQSGPGGGSARLPSRPPHRDRPEAATRRTPPRPGRSASGIRPGRGARPAPSASRGGRITRRPCVKGQPPRPESRRPRPACRRSMWTTTRPTPDPRRAPAT
jgi:hypothetical protein